jgi:hypothetical protein
MLPSGGHALSSLAGNNLAFMELPGWQFALQKEIYLIFTESLKVRSLWGQRQEDSGQISPSLKKPSFVP